MDAINARFTIARFEATAIALLSSVLFVCGCVAPTNNGSPNNSGPSSPIASQELPLWSNSFQGIPFTMVGTDPNKPGAGTSTIPVVIIPVTLSFSLVNFQTSAEQTACGDSVDIVKRVNNSPIFTINTWSDGPITIGQTQFADAFQRANFWAIVSTESPNYHVMLQPVSVLPAITAEVPLNSTLGPNPNPNCLQPIASVPIDFMNAVVQNALASLQLSPDTLPIFLTYNTLFALPAGGFFLGYHNQAGNLPYIVASYSDPGFALFGYDVSDVAALSHEVAEWMDNPVLKNTVPPWGAFGIQPTCGDELEVGDPLTGSIFPVQTSTFTYHMQELAYFSWFARNIPSLAVNGRYSTRGTFVTPAPPCS